MIYTRPVITWEQYRELKRNCWTARDLDAEFRILETLPFWRLRRFVCSVVVAAKELINASD